MNNHILGQIILEGATTVEDAIITKENNDRVEATGTLQDTNVENRKGLAGRQVPFLSGEMSSHSAQSGLVKSVETHESCGKCLSVEKKNARIKLILETLP
jgi:hypothetical protein